MANNKFSIPLSASHKSDGSKFFRANPMTIDSMMEQSSITVNVTCDNLDGDSSVLTFGTKYKDKIIEPEWNKIHSYMKAPLWYNSKGNFFSGGNLNLRKIGEEMPNQEVTIMLFKNNYDNPKAPAYTIAFYPKNKKFGNNTNSNGNVGNSNNEEF